jgi:hypothetical protein
VPSQGEADIVCSLLRSSGIECGDRATGFYVPQAGGFGGWREILVAERDLEVARELLATAQPAE